MFVASRVPGTNGKSYVFVAGLPNRPPGSDRPPFPMGGGPLGFLLTQPRILVLILAAVVLMSGIVCYGLARYLTGPLRRLGVSARQLADGDLTVRVGSVVHNRHDEMGDLGRDFDFMAEQIESLVSSQRRLLRDMSHELRSPLARLNVAVGLVRQRTGADIGWVLDRIEREAQRLNDLIGQLLTLARLEGGTKAKEETQIDLAALIHEIVADAEFEAQSSKRQVRLLSCDECTTTGTPELLRSAIENIVRNGIRYTPEGSQIEISLLCEQHDGKRRAVVRVRDHGPGVPEDSIDDIFRPFYRVDDDRDRQTGGVGLGLAIARQAIRVHGGTITAANAPDGGLRVELNLPALPGTDDPMLSRPGSTRRPA
jgi:two-component system sensor histidine kinase CpxA